MTYQLDKPEYPGQMAMVLVGFQHLPYRLQERDFRRVHAEAEAMRAGKRGWMEPLFETKWGLMRIVGHCELGGRQLPV